MRKIIVLEFVSLDGVMQAPGGREEDTSGGFKYGGWTVPYFDDASRGIMDKQMAMPFALLLGKKTFDIWVNYWPQHADQWPGINEATKYVVTHEPATTDWQNTVFLTGDLVAQLKKLKEEGGSFGSAQDKPNLHVYGSGNFVQTLLKHDLVDEMWLKIFPVTLGQGKKLFEQGTIPAAFKLTSSQVTPSGVIFANYARSGPVTTGSMV